MSFDYFLATTCDHIIHRELIVMDTDRRSLHLSKPLSSSFLKVYASGNLVSGSLYNIITDSSALSTEQMKKIYFRQKWPSPTDFFEVSYITLLNYCPKCSGLGALDDINYTVKGNIRIARDEILLMQNVEKWTVTELKSNPFHSFVGTSLSRLIGERITDFNFLKSKIIQEINTTLGKFSDLQSQYKMTNRPITDGEILKSVESIDVVRDDNDPNIIYVDIVVKALSGKTAEYKQFLKVA